MKKLIMVFFILTLLSLNSIWADENGTVPPLIDITPEEVLVYDMPGDSGNVATVEQTGSAQENALQENTTTQNNNATMEK